MSVSMPSCETSMAETQLTQVDALEHKLGRLVRLGTPMGTFAVAVVLLVMFGPGPAILVLAGGVLLAAVLALWSSLRSLTGDAPLDPRFDDAVVAAQTSVAESRKRAILRALKDLEHERAIGKIDAVDYAAVSGQLRDRAKLLIRELDDEIAPMRARAEQLAAAHLKKKGFAPADVHGAAVEVVAIVPSVTERAKKSPAVCVKCAAANDDDAAFCKKCGSPLAVAEHAPDTAPDTAPDKVPDTAPDTAPDELEDNA